MRPSLRLFPSVLALVAFLAVLFAWPADSHASDADAAPIDTVDLAWYLPDGASHSAGVPRPADVVGFEIGTRHLRPDQLVEYFRVLAEASDRVTLETTGRTYEGRPQILATITSPANHARLDEILDAHRALSEPDPDGQRSSGLDTGQMPVVAYMGYSVHGNEASGSNAAPVVAYHLAASQDGEIKAILENVVILLDPSLNPDGMARFAHWVNMHRGRVTVDDPLHREHREPWPSGRTNHYWFDLNRDWLLARHPETRARLGVFHRWRPNVVTDFHEMGTDSTYFFQPGVESRKNPLTPERNVELTQRFAEEHARALDSLGSLYFTREIFDDFYYGKGSTYPDAQGAVGILFEQASARGHEQESEYGVLTFPFAILNQVTTSFSTLRAARDNRRELLDHQRDFYRRAGVEAAEGEVGGWIVSDAGDPARLAELAELLRAHGIEIRELAQEVTVDGRAYAPGRAFLAPAVQRQALLLRSLFESRTEFEDQTFYDVSTWNMAHAFGLPLATVDGSRSESLAGEAWTAPDAPAFRPDAEAVAYAFGWSSYWAPRALHRLQRRGVVAMVAEKPFTARTAGGEQEFDRGTIVVHLGVQRGGVQDGLGGGAGPRATPATTLETARETVVSALGHVAELDGVEIAAIRGGLTPEGVDLGSPNLHVLEPPRPAILVGEGLSAYEAGQAWHLLDWRFGVETTLLEIGDVASADLSRYSHLVVVDGRRAADEEVVEALRSWVHGGGVLVAIKSAAAWSETAILGLEEGAEGTVVTEADASADNAADTGSDNAADADEIERRPYADFARDRARDLIGGTIFEARLDPTHPLAFGFADEILPLFKNDRTFLSDPSSPYTVVAAYGDDPHLAGYVSQENLDRLQGRPAVLADRVAGGTLVRFADDPNFRAFWYGTSKLFLNAIFFSETLEPRPEEEPRGR